MISLSKIVSGEATVSKELTYGGDESFIPKKLVKFARSGRPVVVWNVTRRCNLRCRHCYASAGQDSELSYEECLAVIDQFSAVGVPLILFSGGEPLLREDIFDIAAYAKKKGMKCVLSTNGTLINEDNFEQLEVFDYVGVSLDGMRETNDAFRGVAGAFDRAIRGLIMASEVTLTGIRFTVTRYNVDDLPEVLKFAREHSIPRFCVYHLVPSGRAEFRDDIDNARRRRVVDYLMEEAEKEGTEILTVDNPADGVYAYLRIGDEKILELLKYRGSDASGVRLVCVDFRGDVHPNQFWWDYTAGNLLKDDFSEIWEKDELFRLLRRKTELLRGKCGMCKFKEFCGGFRVRALRNGDLWGEDPSCYLSTEEIT